MAAAFGGSWYAFRLSDRAKGRDDVHARVAAINRAQFVLIQQLNSLRIIQRQLIDPVRHHPGRYIAMRPGLPVTPTVPRLDIDGLLFILETPDRELPFRLLVEQQRFDEAFAALNERSRLHLEVLQPKLIAARIKEGVDHEPDVFVQALGEEFVRHLQRLTDDTIDNIDKTVESCVALINEFHSKMKVRFPEHSIIRVDPDQPFA